MMQEERRMPRCITSNAFYVAPSSSHRREQKDKNLLFGEECLKSFTISSSDRGDVKNF